MQFIRFAVVAHERICVFVHSICILHCESMMHSVCVFWFIDCCCCILSVFEPSYSQHPPPMLPANTLVISIVDRQMLMRCIFNINFIAGIRSNCNCVTLYIDKMKHEAPQNWPWSNMGFLSLWEIASQFRFAHRFVQYYLVYILDTHCQPLFMKIEWNRWQKVFYSQSWQHIAFAWKVDEILKLSSHILDFRLPANRALVHCAAFD